jgi:hypothetical protein
MSGVSQEDGVPLLLRGTAEQVEQVHVVDRWQFLDGGTLDLGIVREFMPGASPVRRRVTRCLLCPLWFVAGRHQSFWPLVKRIERAAGARAGGGWE